MSERIELAVEPRTDVGKGASRRLRRQGNLVPGIIYGASETPENITLRKNELIKAMEQESFFSQIVALSVNGKTQQAVVRDVQRHPAANEVMHIDFLRVRADQAVTMNVPLHFINEEACVGVKIGRGSIAKSAVEVEVSALPNDLPEYIEVDMEAVEVNQVIHLSDLKLPSGVTLVALTYGADHDLNVASVQPPRGGAAAADEEGAEDAGAEGAEGDSDG
ncbi:MAG: 50S ribosomal protein L25/general stress protein Ctc [Pseudomonadota bacterium]